MSPVYPVFHTAVPVIKMKELKVNVIEDQCIMDDGNCPQKVYIMKKCNL